MAKFSSFSLVALFSLLLLWGCQGAQQPTPETPAPDPEPAPPAVETETGLGFPEWSKNAVMYEVNVRQFSEEGTFAGFEKHLPRLQELGVDILWFMPIHPIGEKNRKGSMGSYYAVKDYRAVNPEFGTMEEFKALVDKCHEMGFKVIIDWVANHTSWDNHLTVDHPDWYFHDSASGDFVPPVADWSDVIHLDYDQAGLREYMTGSLKYWVEEADIDGYRCDVASMVPTDYWEEARAELNKIKPVFMLAEAEKQELHNNAFHMGYAWEMHHHLNEIAQGKGEALDIDTAFVRLDTVFPYHVYKLNFTSNHDENSWNGTVQERMGDASKAMAVMTYTLEGMPLIYCGQEAGLDKRLDFFEKDLIDWKDSEWTPFYQQLNQLKKDNPALWNGIWGGKMERIPTPETPDVFAFKRSKGANMVFVAINLSDQEQTLAEGFLPGLDEGVAEFFGQTVEKTEAGHVLAPWQYYVVPFTVEKS